MSEEYLRYKYTDCYFANNYSNTDNIIRRRDISNTENQFEKGRCLKACLKYFANIDVTTITDLNAHFDCNGNSSAFETRCCCSQHEEQGLNASLILHKASQLSFVIGKVCFKNLFENVPPEQFNKFYQPNCSFCEQKIKVYNKNRPKFCNQKCVKKYHEEEQRKKIELANKKWHEEAAQREIERQKKWEEEAPLREAQEKERKEIFKKIAEQRQRDANYIESQKLKNTKKLYTNCEECDEPKTTQKQKECKLCYSCYLTNRL